jgi:pyrroloquinoline-quinone synthase
MTQGSEFQTELQSSIERYAMLKHPFYQLWSTGKLDVEVLREYAKQYYAHVKAFPTYMSPLIRIVMTSRSGRCFSRI